MECRQIYQSHGWYGLSDIQRPGINHHQSPNDCTWWIHLLVGYHRDSRKWVSTNPCTPMVVVIKEIRKKHLGCIKTRVKNGINNPTQLASWISSINSSITSINSSMTKQLPMKLYMFSPQGTISIWPTSTPTIDFQVTFVSFRGW